MNADEARLKLRELLGQVNPSELPKLLDWMKNSDELDQLLLDNNKVILQSIAEDLRARLPVDAMLPSETAAQHKMQQRQRPTVHVDSFLYSEDQVDALCEEGAMSRNYCLSCGSFRTAPLDFISHSFSVSELQFLFQNVLPDLSGRTVVDVGSRLGAVLYGGYVYSSASRLIGLELSEDFVRLQNDTLHKYGLSDRVQVLHANVCTQEVLLQGADVLVMNNVFEYFMEPTKQIGAWKFIMQAFRRRGALLVTVPSLQESLDALQVPLPPGWVEELPVDYNVYLGRDADPEELRQIHLYRVV
ncbi:uncharacterized protein LOC102226181 isoform X1 [Xiphophorus maculatus]|uniref:Zgc:109986 n=1 Tax=Xiphophorus maculatus TaxID=8083 RepID=A0A3B5QWB2_XIPMA|nr:uncharacterized protein LOC102226181 isoform X1 [Xiphophorus maculatus]XP_032403511.1 uncharacterized protein LOC116709207 isoform X1 [Xiphophorus hellerii]